MTTAAPLPESAIPKPRPKNAPRAISKRKQEEGLVPCRRCGGPTMVSEYPPGYFWPFCLSQCEDQTFETREQATDAWNWWEGEDARDRELRTKTAQVRMIAAWLHARIKCRACRRTEGHTRQCYLKRCHPDEWSVLQQCRKAYRGKQPLPHSAVSADVPALGEG